MSQHEIEDHLARLGMHFQLRRPGTWIIRGPAETSLVITLSDPVVVIRLHLMEVPLKHREEFFWTLLRFNATELAHGAYGIEGDAVVITDTLLLASLDFAKFSAAVEDITLAIASHLPRLARFREPPSS